MSSLIQYGKLGYIVDTSNLMYWRTVATVLLQFYGNSQITGCDRFTMPASSWSSMEVEFLNFINNSSDKSGANVSGIQFAKSIDVLIRFAEAIARGSLDISSALPLTKAGMFPKNRKIELMDSGCRCVSSEHNATERIALFLRTTDTCFTYWDSDRSPSKSGDVAVIGIGIVENYDKSDPLFDMNGNARLQRSTKVSKNDMQSGIVYTGSTGGDFLYVGKAGITFMRNGFKDEYNVYVKMSKANKKLFDMCTSVQQLLDMMEKEAFSKGKDLQDVLVLNRSPKKLVGVADGYNTLQGISGLVQTNTFLFNFI